MTNKQNGFTFIELILSMVLSAILAGVVIEIIAGPIRSYFWYAQQTEWFDMAQMNLESIQRDLNSSLPHSIAIVNESHDKILKFQPVLYKGFVLPNDKPQVPDSILAEHSNEKLYIYFPGDNTILYPWQSELRNKMLTPTPYYVVGALTRYHCLRAEHALTREVLMTDNQNQTSLLTNQIIDCDFKIIANEPHAAVLVSLVFGQANTKMAVTQPIFIGHAL